MIETRTIAANGWRFTVDVAGPAEGPLVLLLHGFPNSRHSWTELLALLGENGYRAVAPDQRGYSPGARPIGIEDYHVDHLVSDVLALADACDARRFHLVGHDWGGQIAWLTASRHPSRLRSLTVLSRPHPAAFAAALRDDPAQADRSRHHMAFQDPGMAARLLTDDASAVRNALCFESVAGLFGKEGSRPKRRMSDELADRHLSVIGSEAAMDAALNWYRAAFAAIAAGGFGDVSPVTVPTLYVWGREDMSVGETAAAMTSRHVTEPYRFVAIDGAGHFLAEEVPDQVGDLLLAHLAANGVS